MRQVSRFEYYKPNNLLEALELIHRLKSVKPIAGGTDLLPLMREGVINVENIVDLNDLDGLSGIKMENGVLRIGAISTLSEILKSSLVMEYAPVLRSAARKVGSVQIRNQGTLAGNLCNASPAADTAPALMVLKARAKIASIRGERTIPVDEIFVGPKMNSLGKDELLTEILIPPQSPGVAAFKKLGRRKGFTLALVNAAAYIEMDEEICLEARIALGAIAEIPLRLFEIEKMLQGKTLNQKNLEDSSKACYDLVNPIDDVRASADYRRKMSCVLVKRAIVEALTKIGGNT